MVERRSIHSLRIPGRVRRRLGAKQKTPQRSTPGAFSILDALAEQIGTEGFLFPRLIRLPVRLTHRIAEIPEHLSGLVRWIAFNSTFGAVLIAEGAVPGTHPNSLHAILSDLGSSGLPAVVHPMCAPHNWHVAQYSPHRGAGHGNCTVHVCSAPPEPSTSFPFG